MRRFIKMNLLIGILTLFIVGCSDNDGQGFASISVKLVDGPGDFDAVKVEVIDVMYKQTNDDDDDSGWESLNAENTGIINLMELTGGNNVVLVEDFAIPAGELEQMRLVLGENNTVHIGESSYPLKTPSGQQSGLKIKVNETLEENITYTFIFDFMVDQSIVMSGNSDNIILKPVINASIEANSGALSGIVTADGIAPVFQVEAQAWIEGGLEPSASALINENGEFVLYGLNDLQLYDIKFVPAADAGFSEKTIEDFEITIGTTIDIGSTELDPIT